MAHATSGAVSLPEHARRFGLADIAIQAAGVDPAVVTRLHDISTHPDEAPPVSDLNPNGSAVQWSVSSQGTGREIRMVIDPAAGSADPQARAAYGRLVTSEVLTLAGAEALSDAEDSLFDATIDRDPSRYRFGAVRLAMALGRPGAAIYTISEPDRNAAHERARRWLGQLLPRNDEANTLLDALDRNASIGGAGLEGTSPIDGRAKLYWHLTTQTALADFGAPLFADRGITWSLERLLGERDLPFSALVISCGFRIATGEVADVKIDVCNHCLQLDNAEATAVARAITRQLGLSDPGLDWWLASAPDARVGCLGIGVNRRGQYRMNTYLYE